MPQRFLRPRIRQSKRWNKLPYVEQSFYIRLLTLVDDYGRYEADSELLSSECFPFGHPEGPKVTAEAVWAWLEHLKSVGMLLLYEIAGKWYLQLTRWQERKRVDSKFPEPPDEFCCQMSADVVKCSPPSPSPSPSPSPLSPPTPSPKSRRRKTGKPPEGEREEIPKKGKRREIPPMPRADYDAMAERLKIPKGCADWFWTIHDARDWVDAAGQPISKVEGLLLAVAKKWKSETGKTNGIPLWRRLEIVEDKISKHPANRDSTHHRRDCPQTLRDEYSSLLSVRSQLQAQALAPSK